MTREQREFEIVVWGASGFTGRLTAEYLAGRFAPGELRWAIAGRNRAKLEAVRDQIGAGSELSILVGDSDDESFLADMAQRSAVVCTTVGPYAKYGSALVAACAAHGADYCDLTGEVHWVQRMIEAHQDAAVASGARIVFSCGFDCIPSDLGAFFMQREMLAHHGVPSSKVQYRVKGFSGGASGGTIASMLTMMEEAERDPSVRRAMTEPYSLNPKDQQTGPDAAERATPSFDADFGQWTAPFVMAAINTKVVRRSNALLDYAYGKGFRYDEAVLTGAGPAGFVKAAGTSAGSAAMTAGMAIGPLRRLVSGRLPQPGEGPSKQKREAGFFEIALRAEHPTDPDKSIRGNILGDRDPGYGSTSKMLGESALCLSRDELAVGGGCWTTASAMGEALLVRLNEHAGVRFTLDD